jgi:hypothetical protein
VGYTQQINQDVINVKGFNMRWVYWVIFWTCWDLFALIVNWSETQKIEEKYGEEIADLIYHKLIKFVWIGPFIYIFWWDIKNTINKVTE